MKSTTFKIPTCTTSGNNVQRTGLEIENDVNVVYTNQSWRSTLLRSHLHETEDGPDGSKGSTHSESGKSWRESSLLSRHSPDSSIDFFRLFSLSSSSFLVDEPFTGPCLLEFGSRIRSIVVRHHSGLGSVVLHTFVATDRGLEIGARGGGGGESGVRGRTLVRAQPFDGRLDVGHDGRSIVDGEIRRRGSSGRADAGSGIGGVRRRWLRVRGTSLAGLAGRTGVGIVVLHRIVVVGDTGHRVV